MRLRIGVVMLACLVISGCATSGNRISKEKIMQVKEGETTRAQVIEILGEPSIVTLDSNGKEILVYHYVKASSNAQNFIPVVGLIQSWMDLQLRSPSGIGCLGFSYRIPDRTANRINQRFLTTAHDCANRKGGVCGPAHYLTAYSTIIVLRI